MKRFFMLLSVLIMSPVLSWGSQDGQDEVRCRMLKSKSQEVTNWIRDYWKFKHDESLSFSDRFEVSNQGARKIVSLIEEIRFLSDQTEPVPLLKDAHRLFDDIDNEDVSRRTALPVLTSGLENLHRKSLDAISAADKNTGCRLRSQSPGINPKAPPIDWDSFVIQNKK